MRLAGSGANGQELRPIMVGLRVYDANGDLVGTVETINQHQGAMRVATNPFVEENLIIPLQLVTLVDGRELYLSSTLQALRADEPAEASGGAHAS